MAAVGRRLRLLRAHGLIAKVSKTHRYVVTQRGRCVITALMAARQPAQKNSQRWPPKNLQYEVHEG